MSEGLITATGWAGSLLVLVAYGLNLFKKIDSNSFPFYLLNILGGILLTVYSVYKDAYANVFINIVWIGIAIPGVIKLFKNKRSTQVS